MRVNISDTYAKANGKPYDILIAGSKLFAKYGFQKTTVNEIAREAGVAKGTMYKYFRSKEEIFSAIMRQENQRMMQILREGVETETTPIGKIRAYVLVKALEFKKAIDSYSITKEVAYELQPLIEAERVKFAEEEIRMLESILQEGVKTGCFRENSSSLTARLITAIAKYVDLELATELDDEEIRRTVDKWTDMLQHGISAKPQGPGGAC